MLFSTGCQNMDDDETFNIKEDLNIEITEINSSKFDLSKKEQRLYGSKQANTEFSFIAKVENRETYIKMEALISNGQLSSSILFRDGNSNWEKLHNISLNTLDSNYKESVGKTIESLAESLKNKVDYPKIDLIENILDKTPEILFNALGKDYYFNLLPQSFLYHLSIFKTTKRTFYNYTNCQCSPSEKFINNDGSPFYCAEDKIVSINEAFDLIENKIKNVKFGDKEFTPFKTLSYLKSTSKKAMSVSKIDEILTDEFMAFWNKNVIKSNGNKVIDKASLTLDELNITTSENLRKDIGCSFPIDPSCLLYGACFGSDCGCCANYNFNCISCSLLCYLHDVECADRHCEPWWCLSGCVDEPCPN